MHISWAQTSCSEVDLDGKPPSCKRADQKEPGCELLTWVIEVVDEELLTSARNKQYGAERVLWWRMWFVGWTKRAINFGYLRYFFTVLLLSRWGCAAEYFRISVEDCWARARKPHTHTDSYLVTLWQEGTKPLGKNCVAGLVSQVFKDEHDVLSVKSFLYLWFVEALSGTWWQLLSVDNWLPWVNFCYEWLLIYIPKWIWLKSVLTSLWKWFPGSRAVVCCFGM